VARLANFTRGTLVQAVIPRRGLTPYARWRDLPAIGSALALLVLVVVLVRRSTPRA